MSGMFATSHQDLESDQIITGTTLTNISGLACNIKPGNMSYFFYFIVFQTDTITDSCKIDISYPGGCDVIAYNIAIPTVVAGVDAQVGSHNRAATGTTVGLTNTNYVSFTHGVIFSRSASGSLTPQAASTGVLSNLTIKAGSCLHVSSIA